MQSFLGGGGGGRGVNKVHCGLRKNGEWAKNDLNTLHVDAHFLRREKKSRYVWTRA